MEFSEVVQLVGSLGFPIVMCLMMYYRMDKQDETHRLEMDKITESLNNNTIALTKLTERLGGDDIK
ncbi:MAG: hypothetical protein J6V44_09560 [Methanobrevibacter sp.]|nr:hypothetical protein [Methanobrevibacter sp.]